MRVNAADLLVILLAGAVLYVVLRARRKVIAQEEAKSDIRRNAIRVWWSEAEARAASYRNIVNAVQSGDQQAVVLGLGKVDFPTNILPLHPILGRAAADSVDIRRIIDDLVSEEERFLEVAHACAERTGRPGLVESPAFQDLKRSHHSMSLSYLCLREQLEDWLVAH